MYSAGGWTIAVRSGIVFVRVYNIKPDNANSWSWKDCPYIIPEVYRPSISITSAVEADSGASAPCINVTEAGKVQLANRGGSSSTEPRYGTMCYPVGI